MGIKSTKGKNKFEQIDYKATSDIGETLDPVFSADATGGTILYHSADDGTSVEKYHVFTEPGYFRVSAGFAKTANVLMVAGGGAGGGSYYAGGGGAGEVLYGQNVGFGTTIAVTNLGEPIPFSSGQEYRVVIGEGGFGQLANPIGQSGDRGGKGGDTLIYATSGVTTSYRSSVGIQTGGLRAFGGGGGGSGNAAGGYKGGCGGSAGGNSYYLDQANFKQRKQGYGYPSAFTAYGNDIANAGSRSDGGGGAGGQNPGRDGGDGQPFPEFASDIIGPAIPTQVLPYWSPVVTSTGLYGGGGGGGGYPGNSPSGGTGGGGAGADGPVDALPGVDYTGGGGGGADDAYTNSGHGGKGILIIKYVV